MKFIPTLKTAALCFAISATASSSFAHRQWLIASTTVLSGEDQWISVEGAISNDLFFPNHVAIPLQATSVLSPSGQEVALQNTTQGKIRSSFEVHLEEQGSYRITTLNDMMFASWTENGEKKRMRATPQEMAEKDLSALEDLELGRFVTRVETIVTCGEPTKIAPAEKGLEFAFVTHPNDLFAGESARFQVLLEGKPQAGVEVIVVKGNDRFRDAVNEIKVSSDEDGYFEISWPEAGRYWINASARQEGEPFQGIPTRQGAACSLTVEVLPE